MLVSGVSVENADRPQIKHQGRGESRIRSLR